MATSSRSTLADGVRIAGRYRVERMLGRGGSATVYCAVDEQTDANIALKHLLADAGSVQHALFQREYYTLAQLRHPAVIQVFDYGVTPAGPFYTMELLDGHDLSELAPLPWVEACRVLREVASALAILHSRRVIHRDISHRNVRVTSDGRTKLIDFGAMAPMGFVPDLIGTPPFVSPEAAYRELLDQRTDLYSLGALAYWLLSGKHLYPAQTIRALRALWAKDAPLALEFPADVPVALQQLTLALMQRAAMARPGTAAEVIDRLIAIAGLPSADDASVVRSYLTNPKLIGRQGALEALRAELERARGGVLLIRGSHGTGKSRLLQEAVMQAQFAGFTVLQTSAHAAGQEPYAVIVRLIDALLREFPQTARLSGERRAVLSWLMPALHPDSGAHAVVRPTQVDELRARVHAELLALLLDLAAGERVLLAIDDLHACDEESLSLLLGVTRDRARGPLVLAALLDSGAPAVPGVTRLCERARRVIELRPLSVPETELLVESLFGSSPHSPRVAGWMHEHSRGNPLECMELARHLVERRAAYYMDGAWMLPSELPAGVPSSLLDAFHARVSALPPAQRSIAELLALLARPAALSLCIELSGVTDDAELFRALDQLVSAELLLVNGDAYALSRDALREALLAGLSPERRSELHQRVADALIARGALDAATKLEAGHHAMRGSARLPGVALVEEAITGQRRLGELGETVVPALKLALELCEHNAAAPARCMRLRARLVNCAVAYDKKLIAYADPLLEQLRRDSGLVFWPELEGSGRERLSNAIARAQQHHASAAPEQRGLAPLEALTELSMVVAAMLGVAIFGLDGATIDRLAEVVAPFADLDKQISLSVIYDLVILIQHIFHGRLRLGHDMRNELLQRLRDPAQYVGLPEEARKATMATQLHALGMWQAPRNGREALATADAIDALGMKAYQGAALQIRLIVHLYAGNAEAAKACQLGIESLSLQGGPGRQTEIWLLAYLVGPYAAWGDVIALKRTAERLAALVPDSPAYRAHMYTALGAYYRERGQLVESKRALEHALALSRTFGPKITAISQYIETLVGAGEHARALEFAQRYVGEVDDDESERAVFRQHLLPLTALAEARLGAVEQAAQRLDAAIAAPDTASRSMAWRVRLHEARARVAIEARDPAAFEAHTERMAELLRTVSSATLLRHRMLLDDGARIGVGPRPASQPAPVPVSSSMPTVQERRSPTAQELARRAGVRERCERALALLLEEVRASGGVLFADGPNGLEVTAKSADATVSSELLEAAQAFAESVAQVEQTQVHAAEWTSPAGDRHELLELQVPGSQGPVLVGVVALRLVHSADQRPASAQWLSAVARALQEAVELGTGRPFEAWMEL